MTGNFSGFRLALAALGLVCTLALAAAATADGGSDDPDGAGGPQRRGPETSLPLPRYVSLKSSEVNVRRGPSLTHRIDWVYHRKELPMQITEEYGNWRQVRDRDGAGGWVHYSLLSGVRTVTIEAESLSLFSAPDVNSQVEAIAEQGVVARLNECLIDWCRIKIGPHRGWVRKASLWGVSASELRD